MHIDVADILRCPAPHEDTWLVVRVDRMAGRHIEDGIFGCPICGAEYAVRDGVADFRRNQGDVVPAGALRTGDFAPEEALVVRAAAQLGLGEGGRLVLLTRDGAGIAVALGRIAPVHVVLADPAVTAERLEHVSVLLTDGDRLPLAAASLHGALLDRAAGVPPDAVLQLLRAGGRLVAPAHVPIPPGLTVLARDDAQWVGERRGAVSSPVTLRLAR